MPFMRLVRGLTNLRLLAGQPGSPLRDGCVATIGNFDGVHIGHQRIIRQVRDAANSRGVPSVVMVFEPQPREFFQGDEAPPRLTGFRQKMEALLGEGVDSVVCLRFNDELRQYSGREFVDQILVDGLRPLHLVIGDDFRFGHDRSGDFDLLREVGKTAGYSVEHTETVTVEGERVSSTQVRGYLQANQLEQAARLLGHQYAIEGRVVYGRQLGRELGAPTVNINLQRCAPLRGVYVVSVRLADGRICDGVANIGLRPTVDGRQPSLEVHLFDFAGTLYGQRIRVTFRQPLRDEVKFDSVEALKHQIHQDFRDAKAWLETR
jgi:riboflavin kinase/FMN adenylyltransferase